jgi:hypothetical protein
MPERRRGAGGLSDSNAMLFATFLIDADSEAVLAGMMM